MVLVGIFTAAAFDHYWWTMPPARMLIAVVLGLWAQEGNAGFAAQTDRL
jgi:hypothetical protein